MFLDEAIITVHGGKGGNGIVAWRKEKYVPRGGPYGGDGGKGGDVVLRADTQTDTLTIFAEEKVFRADDGKNGATSRKHGKNGADRILLVPPGTLVRDAESKVLIADLVQAGQEVILAKGGRGGYGNAHFTSSVRQAPDFAENGEPGHMRKISLELKLIAEVGIIGLPSVGKSTLISVISGAKPKIAEYPFTTLVPNLGVVTVHGKSFIACDVPGLIEGASNGKGLGDAFLRHIERCGVLVHLLDASREDLVEDYRTIRKELTAYSPALAAKRELVVLSKSDIADEKIKAHVISLEAEKIPVATILSAATHKGITEFLNQLLPIVLEERRCRIEEGMETLEEIPTLHPQEEGEHAGNFQIQKNDDGSFIIRGKRIEQIAAMTNFESSGGAQRFRDIVERIKLRKTLEQHGATDASVVLIGEANVTGLWR